ncbi:endonuclease/exonuclease/phosphatase family protein [Dysgonomonas sp. 216]|uniref:endonuclease/exonuclease/phosphatase family protein n=1 Tax=Dysgonomonas sp. 216 TaxID=2302934 RepID=UPI0013D0E5F0|nr:endonuclease/exonuclease/phosphatase family protein [Dysgonomonas sp. 216]NDW19689.1 endonuclease/exonuclease/phosphatase family protein [Dysgonomonas sp. 216]
MRLLFFIIILSVHILSYSQEKAQLYSVAFYNVENLYDTKRDKSIEDADFTPQGAKKWTNDKYEKKIENISEVLAKLGNNTKRLQPCIIGLAEVENRAVLEDLIHSKNLKKNNYKIIHRDSPDKRGIDVALLYNPSIFKPSGYSTYKFASADSPWYKSRDFLLVSGSIANEKVHIIVNHWPSRRGESSSELREYAASVCKHIHDSIYKKEPTSKIIIMGDLNDNPDDNSCRLMLKARKSVSAVKKGGLYNTMWSLYKKGEGSYRYQRKWNMYDQIIISESLLNKKSALKYVGAEVFNPDFLFQHKGAFRGYPFRSFSGNTFINGYSDHLPIIIFLSHDTKL